MVKNKQKIHNTLFTQQLNEKKLLVAAHRGISGGNIIGNTIPGFKAALQSGADIIEFDVIKSTDGILYIYHDGTEPFHLRVKQNIKTMSSKQIEKLRYYNSANFYSEFGIEKLDNVLEEFAGKTLMNIDRAWDIFPDLLEKLGQFNVKDHVLIKSPVKNQPLSFLNDFGRDYMFMPIIKKYDEIEKVQQYDHINMVGMELVTKSPEDRLFKDETVSEFKDLGFFAWVNSITFDHKHILYGGLDDNTSIIESPDKGWGSLIDKGFDIILTDWPGLLYSYREKRFGGKA
jgi:glycerophosphoryl diester phosphodiesterase